MSDIYKIKPANLEALFEKIAKLNKRAVVNVLGSEMIKTSKVMPGGRILKYEYEVKLVNVTGDTRNFSIVEACGDFEGNGGSYAEAIDTIEFLNATAICIRRLGWMGKGACPIAGHSTSSEAWWLCRPNCKTDEERQVHERWVEKRNLIHQKCDEKQAAEALAWAITMPFESSPGYLSNLGVNCRAGYVTHRTAGIVSSTINAYLQHCD